MLEEKLRTYKIVYNEEKREETLVKHQIDLEEIKNMIHNWNFIKVIQHPSPQYKEQLLVIVNYRNYPVCCPIKINDEKQDIKLITAFKNRNFKPLLDKNESQVKHFKN